MTSEKMFFASPCPRCGAAAGEPCRTRGGKIAQTHVARLRVGKAPDVILHPEAWRASFLKSTLRTSFCLALSQTMLELLCAIADGVQWDRAVFRYAMGDIVRDGMARAAKALQDRGLVRHRGAAVVQEARDRSTEQKRRDVLEHKFNAYELTPAGEKLVELLALTGIFIEASAAADLRLRGRLLGPGARKTRSGGR